jgi:hypothetical protein
MRQQSRQDPSKLRQLDGEHCDVCCGWVDGLGHAGGVCLQLMLGVWGGCR